MSKHISDLEARRCDPFAAMVARNAAPAARVEAASAADIEAVKHYREMKKHNIFEAAAFLRANQGSVVRGLDALRAAEAEPGPEAA